MEITAIKIAAAQIKPIEQNTHSNIQTHLQMIDLAARQNVELIVFPEMALTGYEREMAKQLSFTEDDVRLNVFKDKAEANKMLIIVGAPIKIDSTLHIGSFKFLPTGLLRHTRSNFCTVEKKSILHHLVITTH